MRVRLALFVVAVLAVPLVAVGYTLPGQPDGYVSDFANIVSDTEEQALEEKLGAFDRDTSNQIAVATIASLEGDTIENFAVKLFEDWGIGTQKNDNGILLLVARDDREVRIEVGYGLEGALTDIQANDIIEDDIVPAFREERYGEGIDRAVDDMMAATRGEYQGGGQMPDVFGWLENSPWIFFVAIFLMQWCSAILARSKSWWAGGVVGAGIGAFLGIMLGWLFWGLIAVAVLTPLGLLFDYLVSSTYRKRTKGEHLPWWIGGGHGGGFGSSGGSFGGFGGGSSGGGGASGRW